MMPSVPSGLHVCDLTKVIFAGEDNKQNRNFEPNSKNIRTAAAENRF